MEELYRIVINAGIERTENVEGYSKKINKMKKFISSDTFEHKIEKVISLTKALASEVRLKILAILILQDKTCLCELNELLDIDPSTLTYHISLLKRAGLVKVKRKGKIKIVIPERRMKESLPKDFVESLELKKK